MLTIRFQRTGRTGHAQFRVVAQDSRTHPTRGKVVAYLGSYDPHAKTTTLDVEKISDYLSKGAQPSDTVAKLLKREGVKLPSWVKEPAHKAKSIKNPEKLRRNRPDGEPAPEKPEANEEAAPEAETPKEEIAAAEAPAAEEAPAEPAPEIPAEPAVEEAAVEPEADPAPES